VNFVYLHGMGGSARDWIEVQKFLPGEALSLPRSKSFSELISQLANMLDSRKDLILCGYSMGGRIAILLAVELLRRKNPIRGLALLGAGLGFSDESERATRREIDEKWAKLAASDLEKFWEEWYRQQLFDSFQKLPAAAKAGWLKNRKSMDIGSLIEQLRNLGPAEHPDLFPLLEEIENAGISVLYLAGELDKKYLNLGQRLEHDLGLELGVIPGAGHILPLEAPKIVAERLSKFFPSAN
jgi:2-succinyl-6-hydroxy-2,4-cyclohexadiene-1-carboxylate synthase